ncbi:MAG: hypothetical protein WC449_06235 [Candidatus Paceibacterota bacterium]
MKKLSKEMSRFLFESSRDSVNCEPHKKHYGTSKKSSYQKLKDEVHRLIENNNKYYEANYQARKAVGSNEVYGGMSICGNEEGMPVTDPKELKKIIMSLPI